jgi:hypothetical protein
MTGEALNAAGLSGDLGWNEAEEMPMVRLSTALLVLATGAVWSSVWLLSGLPPLAALARCVPNLPAICAEHLATREGSWRTKHA